MTNLRPDAKPLPDLPSAMREKIRTTTVAPQQPLAGTGASIPSQADDNRTSSLGHKARSTFLPLAERARAMVRRAQLPGSPEQRSEFLKRGKQAGSSIGSTLDKIVRQLPTDRSPPTTVDVNADLKTTAVRSAVRQPSILDPGHLLTALLTGGIVHIVTTFAITSLGTGSAFRTLRPVLPANEFVVMPTLTPSTQPLPYLAPDMLYAFCRFDLARGPIEVSTQLMETGWSLALYTRNGDNFYATPGNSDKPTNTQFLLLPATDRLITMTPGARKQDADVAHVTSPDQQGLVVIRAPLKGIAFEDLVRTDLKAAKCAPRLPSK